MLGCCCVIALLVVAGPIGVSIAGVLGELANPEHEIALPSLTLIVQSLLQAGLIAGLAAGLALPTARVMVGGESRMILLVVAGMLMPSYLAYAGWGLVRSPGTAVGDWLALDAMRSIVFGKVLAIVGLGLWSWPLAAIVQALHLQRVDRSLFELSALDSRSWLQRLRIEFGFVRRGLGWSWVVVCVVMLGSAVPMHLAQMRTMTVWLWTVLERTPWEQRGGVWIAAWPSVLMGLTLGVMVCMGAWSSLFGEGRANRGAGRLQARRADGVLTAIIWLMAVGGPLLMFALSVREFSSLGRFWMLNTNAAEDSALVGLMVAFVCLVLIVGCWLGLSFSRASARVALMVVGLFMISGLVPGVMVGAWTHSFWWAIGRSVGLDQTVLPLVSAHVARFGMVACLAGVWLAMDESTSEKGLRLMDAGSARFRAWIRVRLLGAWPVVVGVGVAVWLLSFHEVESSIMVRPAGMDSFPHAMLGLLHYARDEDLSAAMVQMLAIGLMIAISASWLTFDFRYGFVKPKD